MPDRTRHRIKMKICGGGGAHHKWIRGAIAVSPPVFYYALTVVSELNAFDTTGPRSYRRCFLSYIAFVMVR
jgi:hypothetical protein